MLERRTILRFDMRLPVLIRPESDAPAPLVSETRDVSSRGIYFTLDRDLPIGSPVEVLLTLPDEITQVGAVRVRCRGHIVRVEGKSGEQRTLGVATVIDRYEFMRPEEATH